MITIISLLSWTFVNLDTDLMIDHTTSSLWIHAPSTIPSGTPQKLLVEAWDTFERVSKIYNGKVSFTLRSFNLTTLSPLSPQQVSASLPSPYRFSNPSRVHPLPTAVKQRRCDRGTHTFSFSISTPGIHYILVDDSSTKHTYWSNPILVDDSSLELVWGDLHGHSLLSDGSGSPQHFYRFAKNIAGLEFCALTDHGENLHFHHKFSTIQRQTNQANNPHEFITFPGVEWTSGGVHTPPKSWGHYTCIFSGSKLPQISADIQKTPKKLWNTLDKFTSNPNTNALAIPHHCVRKSFLQDWAYVLPTQVYTNYVRLAEAYSVHGSSLVNPYSSYNLTGSVDTHSSRIYGSDINAALKMGIRMGIIANGDTHDGRPGHSISHAHIPKGHQRPFTYDYARLTHPYPSGITGVFAPHLTRRAVFKSLYKRKVLACSDHGRPIIQFSINEVKIGENNSTVYIDNPSEPRTLSIFLAQDGNPPAYYKHAVEPWKGSPLWKATVQIFKNGKIWKERTINKPVYRHNFTDTTTVSGTSYDHYVKQDGKWYINRDSRKPVDPTRLTTNGADYYFLRLISNSKRITTIGPIWVQTYNS